MNADEVEVASAISCEDSSHTPRRQSRAPAASMRTRTPPALEGQEPTLSDVASRDSKTHSPRQYGAGPYRKKAGGGSCQCVCVDRRQFRTHLLTRPAPQTPRDAPRRQPAPTQPHTRPHATHEHVARRFVLACSRTKSNLAHAPPSKHRPCTRASPSTSQEPCSSAQTALCLFALANESAVAPVLALVFLVRARLDSVRAQCS